jgi:archaellum component FlaC
MREWLLANSLTSEDELEELEKEVKELVRQKKNEAWQRYLNPIKEQVVKSVELINDAANKLPAYSSE